MDKGKGKIAEYSIVRKIEETNYAIIYKAKDSKNNLLVLKITRKNKLNEIIIREFKILSQFRHPNIIQVYDYGQTDDGEAFFTLEYIRGQPINRYFKGYSKNFLSVLLQIVEALGTIHEKGFVHSDLKPEHILYLPAQKKAILIDFGFTQPADVSHMANPGVKKMIHAGTIGYIAPEVLKGFNFDTRADLYSLGVIIYEILAGQRPKHTFEPISGISGELNNTLARLLSKEPAIRPSIIELHTTFSMYFPLIKTKKPCYNITLPKTGFVKIPEIVSVLTNTWGKAVTLFGETGSGKTRLLNELKFKFLIQGCNVLFYTPEHDVNFLNALYRFINYEILDFSKYDDKLQIYDELLNRLLLLAKNKNIVIMVDDCENLSDYELGLLRYIGYGIENSKILIIETSKPDEKIQNLNFTSLSMRPFVAKETRELLEKTFFKIKSRLNFTQWLYEHSGGNPLFIIEILNTLFENNILYYQSGKWCIKGKLLNKFQIPDKIDELIQKRLKSLNVNEQKILKIASVCTAPLDAQILNFIVKSETYISIEHLKNYGLLKEEIINNRIIYAIPNRIIRYIIEKSITKKEKQSLQQNLLNAIEKIYPQDSRFIPVLAELYNSSQKKRQASVYCLKAAKNAEKIYDYETSLKYYEMQAQCIEKTKSEKYLNTLIKLANINQIIGNNRLAIDYYNRALTIKKPQLKEKIYLGVGSTYRIIGEHKKAIKYYRKAMSLVKEKNTKGCIKIINFLGYSMLYLNKFKDAELLFNQALNISKRINDLELESETQYYRAVSDWFTNNYNQGIKKAKKNLEFTKRHRLLNQYAYTANLLSSFFQQKNNIDQAQKYLDEAITIFKQKKHINTLCNVLNNKALLQLNHGNLIKAKELFNKALILARQTDNQTTQYASLINLAIINKSIGKFDEAINYYDNASQIYPDKPDHVYGIAMILYEKGEIDEARALLEQNMESNKEILYFFGLAVIESALAKYEKSVKLINKGLKKIETENPSTQTKVEAFLRTSQFYYETGDFKLSKDFVLKLKNLTNPLSREHTIASALIKINNYNLKKSDEIDINKETQRLKHIGCIYDWAWIKKLRIESIVNQGPEPSRIKSIAQELSEIEEIFKSLGAGLELNRSRKIQDRLFPIIVKDYSRRTISIQYLETFSRLAVLISQHLGDEDFIQNTLDLIIQTTNAERGALFIKTAKTMDFVAGRDIDHTTIKDAKALSKSAINALKKEQIIFSTNALTDPNFSTKKSVMLQQIRSLICIPLMVSKNVIGAIYLDSRISTGIFSPQDKDFLLTVSQILGSVIEKSIVFRKITDENILLKTKILQEIGTGYLIGKSRRMKQIYRLIQDIAPTDSPVLITGETGTGKGMIARLIHLKSKRKHNKFLSINCGTITETLFESELFGHKRGAFTGAITDKNGLLEEAEAGTVFLDEITNTSIGFQAKLLEAIEEKVIRRVGETKTRKIDTRFLFATNKDLEIEMEDNRFRKDLFYRINVFGIEVPPLREREKDIPLLTRFFLKKYCKEINKQINGFTQEALTYLKKHFWPGNVRELQNVIERAVIRAKTNVITGKDLGFEDKKEVIIPLKEIKKEAIIEALSASQWNVKKAAQMLNINRRTIHRYINQYNIKIK